MIGANFDFVFTMSIDSREVLLLGHLAAVAKSSGASSSSRFNSLTITATVNRPS